MKPPVKPRRRNRNNSNRYQSMKQGVNKPKEMMSKKMMSMRMQSPFAHAANDSTPWWLKDSVVKTKKNSSKKPAMHHEEEPEEDLEEMFEIDVAFYEGKDIPSLKRYLINGNIDCSQWSERTFKELLEQLEDGKCELGLDPEGNALRVASVAKVFFHDEHKKVVLMNVLNSKESPNYIAHCRKKIETSKGLLQNAVTKASGLKSGQKPPANIKSYNSVNFKGAAGQRMRGGIDRRTRKGKKKHRRRDEIVSEIPGALVFETTFSPFTETPRDAAARVVSWRFDLDQVTSRLFIDSVPFVEREYVSEHFPGLKSEYHVHHVKLKPEFIVPIQKMIPVGGMLGLPLDELTNTGINIHWYCWASTEQEPAEIVEQLEKLYYKTTKVKSAVGRADFSSPLAKEMGKFVQEEASLVSVWNN